MTVLIDNAGRMTSGLFYQAIEYVTLLAWGLSGHFHKQRLAAQRAVRLNAGTRSIDANHIVTSVKQTAPRYADCMMLMKVWA